MNWTKEQLSRDIKQKGKTLGFELTGISAATFLEEEARDLEQWLGRNFHGSMGYMENYFDKRTDPRLLVEGAQSVISVIHNYFPKQPLPTSPEVPKISRYAWGMDYHKVLKTKLYQLLLYIQELTNDEATGRVFVDSAPVMDKAWAKRSGLGWIGKHTNLIVPKMGSYFFIGEIIINLPLIYDGPIKDFCGTCTRCIDACPTEALTPYQIDANKCISYLTIELKEDISENFGPQMEGWVYGCDICQEVCPWNRFSHPQADGSYEGMDHWNKTLNEWEEIDEKAYKKLTKKTAMNRVKWKKFKHNLFLWKKNRTK